MQQFLIVLTTAVLFFGSNIAIYGQYQGCVNSESMSRLAFQVHPYAPNSNQTEKSSAKVQVKPGEIIALVISRIDQTYTEAHVINGQRAAPYIYLDPLRNITIPTDNLYAFVEFAGGSNYKYVPQGEKYVFPIDSPRDNTEVDGKKVRLLRFNNNNELEFDTKGMNDGFYWITLQGNVTFSGQNRETCAKTTPPVLIEIRSVPVKISPIDHKPTLNLKIDGNACEPRTLTAVAEDSDNFPNSGLPRQTLSLNWEIYDDDGQAVNFQKTSIGTPTEARYSEQINLKDLKLGIYRVKVTVSDETYTAEDENIFTVSCRGAGIIYFQFDEPYKTRAGLLDPESWIGNYNRKNQCRSGSYPETEFDLFYDLIGISRPTYLRSNTEKLREIIELLNANPKYKLHIAGYADFRANQKYNYELVNRRTGVVKEYLRNMGINIDRITEETVNFSDIKARSCLANACDDSRRHDRRVELIYYTTGDKPPLPIYTDSTCPVNANLFINPIYENDLVIITDE